MGPAGLRRPRGVGVALLLLVVLVNLPLVDAARRGEVGDLGPVLGFAVFADVVLAGAFLAWRRRASTTSQLHLRAVADVERCRPGAGVEVDDEGTWTVTGEVCLVAADRIDLAVGARVVRVDLAGHANRVGYQQPARVRGTPVGTVPPLSDFGA